VWDNCGQTNSDRLEKVQLEAARIVTGLPSFASIHSIYIETGWEKLKTRREVGVSAVDEGSDLECSII
jgi:hypothetical protein